MLQYSFDAAKCLDHIRAVIVQVPELTIMLLMCPPEWVLLKDLILLEVLTDTPAFVISECQAIFLEQSVDPWHTSIP